MPEQAYDPRTSHFPPRERKRDIAGDVVDFDAILGMRGGGSFARSVASR